MLLFASQKCKTFAVLLVPAELSRRSLIFAPRGGFAAVSFFYRFFLDPPDAVFALHDSRVQISWRKLAIPSRLALLTGVESAGRRHRRRKANFATPRATARGVCMYACAKPHRKFFRRGPRFMPHRKCFRRGPRFMPHRKYFRRGPRFYTPQNIRFAGTPDITPPKLLSVGTPIYAPQNMRFAGAPV